MSRLEGMTQSRIANLSKFQQAGLDPYPYAINRTHTAKQAALKDDHKVTVVGRLMSWRGHGKLQFADLVDESGQIQLAFKFDNLPPESFEQLKWLDVGDFVEVTGTTFTTKTGERTIEVKSWQLICKTIKPLPSTWYGLKDTEDRYRRRYLDLILNPEVKQRLMLRSQIIRELRDFLNMLGFMEVETPTLQPIYGGGFARPFITHHNVLDADFYLRISDEMYLKRLIVGGFEKVYEITKVFRNEGIDFDHNPEFTMFEAMIAYQDYRYGMDLIEEIIEHLAQKVLGKTTFEYQGTEISVKRPWKRFTMVEAIKTYAGIDPLSWTTVDEAVIAAHKLDGIPGDKLNELKKVRTIGEVIAFVFEETVEAKLIEPTIIYDYPIENSPLSKKCPDPRFTQRFEMFAFGSELGNNYTELNDPVDLKHRFIEEKKREQAGFAEAHQTDYDYLEAIEHGFPPTCGIAIGIDRLVMLLTNTASIKEIIAFPTLKPLNVNPESKEYNYADRKIVLLVDPELPSGKIANAVGHLSFAGGHAVDSSWYGREKLTDADGGVHPGISRYPVIVLAAAPDQIKKIREQAQSHGLAVRDFPKAMFTTSHDDELTQKLNKQKAAEITYHALLIIGESAAIDPLTANLKVLK